MAVITSRILAHVGIPQSLKVSPMLALLPPFCFVTRKCSIAAKLVRPFLQDLDI